MSKEQERADRPRGRPGVNPDDIKSEVLDGILTFSGEQGEKPGRDAVRPRSVGTTLESRSEFLLTVR
jgi:hypothetical protein